MLFDPAWRSRAIGRASWSPWANTGAANARVEMAAARIPISSRFITGDGSGPTARIQYADVAGGPFGRSRSAVQAPDLSGQGGREGDPGQIGQQQGAGTASRPLERDDRGGNGQPQGDAHEERSPKLVLHE